MGFASGSISFRRFAIQGQQPKHLDQKVLDALEEHVLTEREYGLPEEIEYGWCGGRHVLDGKFTFEHNVFAEAVHCAMRLDTNRVPGELKKAYQIIEEEAAAAKNPSGFISKQQKREAKDSARKKIEEDLKSGKFRRSKLVPILWDHPAAMLYSPVSASQFDKLAELFERTFELTLEPLTAGEEALRYLADKGKRRDYEDARPTRFATGPEGESQQPDYPWCAMGPQPKDFLGNEFLVWLWHETETHGGVIKTDSAGEVAIVLDQSLELECAYGQTGKDSLRSEGPTRMPEARDALRCGKVLRKAGLILESGGHQFTITLNAETLGCSGVKLPDVEEADEPRVIFEERIAMLRELGKALDGVFHAFLKLRAGSTWESQTTAIRRWIQSPKAAAVA